MCENISVNISKGLVHFMYSISHVIYILFRNKIFAMTNHFIVVLAQLIKRL